jgi:hypothetical protein
MEDDAEVSEEWLVQAASAHEAVERASTHARFPPHHVETRRVEPGEELEIGSKTPVRLDPDD